jgi:hypothetical protein
LIGVRPDWTSSPTSKRTGVRADWVAFPRGAPSALVRHRLARERTKRVAARRSAAVTLLVSVALLLAVAPAGAATPQMPVSP